MARKSKPYATMADGPDAYLFRKDGKQKLVGSADNEPEAGEEELAEDEGYQYRTYTDYEEDNMKIWHEGRAPGGDWEIIDRSPYAEMDKFAWDLYVDFHKENGRWPNQKESRKIEDLEYKVMTKMNEELNEIRALAGLPPVAEDCDETPGEDKNEDGDCSPFTHADENVDMVKEEEQCPECGGVGEVWGKACEKCGGEEALEEDLFDEDFLAPPKDVEHGHFEDDEGEEDDDWDVRDAPELDRQTNYDAPSRFDGDDSYDMYDDMYEQGPGDDEFDADPDAMVDVGDDEDYEVFDFEDEFDAMMGNTTRFESVEEQIVAMNEIRKAAGLAPIEEAKPDFLDLDDDGDTEEDMKDAAEDKEKVEEGEGDTCSRCRKGKMERGETFFGPAERCNHCGFQRQLESVEESAPHPTDDTIPFEFNNEQAYYLVADEIGDKISFGQFDEILVPEQYVDGIIMLLDTHGFEQGSDFVISTMDEALGNGYGEHEYADAYDDYFPLGSHQTPSDDLGPTASGYGDNAMDNKMRSKDAEDVYESMRQKYRRYRLS
jgi:hypothetical protein